MPKGISYTRFSAIHQGKGSTQDRQDRMVAQWFIDNPEVSRSDLSVVDKGKSAYKGDHLSYGLGSILRAIDEGFISSGDYILVEAIDRLGRMEPMEMFGLMQQIVSRDVTLVTLEDGVEYTKELLNEQVSSLYVLVGKIQQAHEYSKNLSRRLKASYDKRRDLAKKGEAIKLVSPFWLDDSCQLIPKNATIVKDCIDLYLKGRGARRILLDLVGTYPELKSTHPTTLMRWFRSRVLIGEWETKGGVIKDVFEPLIDEKTFYLIQGQLQKRRKEMSPEEKYELSGLVVCDCCGSRFYFRRKKHKDYTIIYANCSGYLKRGALGCNNNKTWPYDVLMYVFDNSFNDVLSSAVEEKLDNSLLEEKKILEARLVEKNEQIDSVLALGIDNAASENIRQRIRELGEDKDLLLTEITNLEASLSSSESGIGVSLADFNVEFFGILDDSVHLREVLKTRGYKIKIKANEARVEVGEGWFRYSLFKRSTRLNCYFVEFDASENYGFLKMKLAINREGLITSSDAETWEEFEEDVLVFQDTGVEPKIRG